MENAAKALIIAATTLLGILLLSVMVYVFRAGASVDEQYDANQAQRQLELYNSGFELYNTQYNTIIDLITVCNRAYNRNIESDYDNKIAVNITIKIGSKVFEIPADKAKATSAGLGKNQIVFNNSAISIYNLADSTLDELGVSAVGKPSDKLSKSFTGRITYKKNKYGENLWECARDNCGRTVVDVSKPATCPSCGGTNLNAKDNVNTATVYKYIFNCSEIKYDQVTGRVNAMTFELNKVTDPDSILYWDSSKYE